MSRLRRLLVTIPCLFGLHRWGEAILRDEHAEIAGWRFCRRSGCSAIDHWTAPHPDPQRAHGRPWHRGLA